MKIYLVRHSQAVPAYADLPDSFRHLDLSGRQQCRAVGRLLREANVTFDYVLTSPYTRAVQTAELMAEAVDYLGIVEAHTCLVPGAQPQVAVREIMRRSQSLPGTDGAVAIFSHEPTVSDLAAFLVGRPGFAPFRTGQVCLFEDRQPVWKIHPGALQFQDLHTA